MQLIIKKTVTDIKAELTFNKIKINANNGIETKPINNRNNKKITLINKIKVKQNKNIKHKIIVIV